MSFSADAARQVIAGSVWISPAAAARKNAPRCPRAGRTRAIHHEPLFTLFFLAADFLPFVRLSPRGGNLGRQSSSRCCSATCPRADQIDAPISRRRAALAVLLAVAVGSTALPKPHATPAGAFGRGTLEGRAYRVAAEPASAGASADRGVAWECWRTPEDFALGFSA